MKELIVQNFPVPYGTIVKSEVEMLSEIVNSLTNEIEDLNEELTTIELIYRNKSPDLIPIVYDMEQRLNAKAPQETEKKVKASKATKMLWKRLSQLTHSDKASEELKDEFRKIFVKGAEAYRRNDSAVLKILLDYVVKLRTTSNIKAMDTDDTLELKILEDLKVSRTNLTHSLESLKTSTLYIVKTLHESNRFEEALFIYKNHLIMNYNIMKGKL